MRMLAILLTTLISGCAVGREQNPPSSGHASFWRWFQDHDQALFAVKTADELICNHLAAQLRKVHDTLVFEFGPIAKGRREFVISAGGIRDGFAAVIALSKAAPPLTRWRITAFRPRREPMTIQMHGITVVPTQVAVLPIHEGGKISLVVSMTGYKPTPKHAYEEIGFLLLDGALGEYTMETRIGAVDFVAAASRPKGQWLSLRDLPKAVDANIKH